MTPFDKKSFGALLCAGAMATSLFAGDGIVERLVGKKEAKPAEAAPIVESSRIRWSEPVAKINGESITWEQLADELVAIHGEKQLDLMIKRKVVEQALRAKKLDVTKVEVEKDVAETIKKLNVNRKEFVKNVLKSRDLTYSQYVRDIVWPQLALKKLVEDKVKITDDEIQKAFEANYGEKVDVRMLVVSEMRRAQELWNQVQDTKEQDKRLKVFEEICKNYSIDNATRQFGGQTQPINRHSTFPEVEKLAFDLKPGELSKIIQAPEGYLMLYCVKKIPANKDVTLDTKFDEKSTDTVRDTLRRNLREEVLRAEVTKYFVGLFDKSKVSIQNFLTGEFEQSDVRPVGHVEPTKETTKK